jgi:hypothetical protein
MGALRSCLGTSREYALERVQWGKKLAEFQLVQRKLADAGTELGLGVLAAIQVCLDLSSFTISYLPPPAALSAPYSQNLTQCDRLVG